MNHNFKSLEGLIFLTYFTNYNINRIFYAIESDLSYDNLIDFYFKEGENRNLKNPLSHNDFQKLLESSLKSTENCIAQLKYYDIKTLTFFEKDYPPSLKNIRQPPPVLFYKGEMKLKRLGAVVGTRKISNNAHKLTKVIVDNLVDNNYGVISGLALGIDTLAHKRAIERNSYTAAILPTSLNTIYPKNNFELANQILERGGAIISELAFDINRGKQSFVERNRIQAGISDLVIPVEMGIKSGTMHTINFAISFEKLILLLNPTNSYQSLPQYEGIRYLLSKQKEKPKNNVRIIINRNDFIKALNDDPDDSFIQGELFRDY